MAKCAFCKVKATTMDVLGLDVCATHSHSADDYFRKTKGQEPDCDSFLYCDLHCDMWQPDCDRCEVCAQHHYGMAVQEFLDSPLSKQMRVISFDSKDDFISFLGELRGG